jgi:heme-degrading monooxygenase HmoA
VKRKLFFPDVFKAAISTQAGFRDAQFLRPDDGGPYIPVITFDNQQFQKQWAASAFHERVWPQMEENFDTYSVKTYGVV